MGDVVRVERKGSDSSGSQPVLLDQGVGLIAVLDVLQHAFERLPLVQVAGWRRLVIVLDILPKREWPICTEEFL